MEVLRPHSPHVVTSRVLVSSSVADSVVLRVLAEAIVLVVWSVGVGAGKGSGCTRMLFVVWLLGKLWLG